MACRFETSHVLLLVDRDAGPDREGARSHAGGGQGCRTSRLSIGAASLGLAGTGTIAATAWGCCVVATERAAAGGAGANVVPSLLSDRASKEKRARNVSAAGPER